MDYGIKISKQGYDVLDKNKRRTDGIKEKPILPHLLYFIALPYLQGARKQVERYQIAAATLKERPSKSVCECLHEASTLFEDLSTIGKYAEKCGDKNNIHKLWLDVRNHIRHDVREEFDNETSKLKNERAERLKLSPKLQISIGFAIDCIKVGGITIEINQVNSYLEWAEYIISKTLKDAQKKGYIKL